METELPSTEPQRVCAAPESSRERIDVRDRRPLGAQDIVLGERVAPRAGPREAEPASTSTDLFDGSAKAARQRSRGKPDIGGRVAQHRVLERRPGARRSPGREAERCSARRDRVLRAPDLVRDRGQREICPDRGQREICRYRRRSRRSSSGRQRAATSFRAAGHQVSESSRSFATVTSTAAVTVKSTAMTGTRSTSSRSPR